MVMFVHGLVGLPRRLPDAVDYLSSGKGCLTLGLWVAGLVTIS
jgi:hypothetical protein